MEPIDPRDREAAAVLARHLDEPSLPPFVPGEPRGLMAAVAARRLAPWVLAELGAIYDVESWDEATFERHVLRGALPAWSPEARLLERDGVLTTSIRVCPVASTRRDPRVCDLCQRTWEAMADIAAPGLDLDVAVDPGGATACRMTCRARPITAST